MNLFTFLPSALLLLAIAFDIVDSRSFYRSNICAVINERPRCCMGWALDETNLHCTQPVCTGRCEVAGGRCLSPDTCLCPGGYVAFSCYVGREEETSPACNIQCKNGGTCKGDKCECLKGFSGERCEIASCLNDCSKRGSCQSDGQCKCNKGYSGMDCSEDIKDSCYMDVSRGLCRKELKQKPTTMEVCCNSLGAAWGTPCKKCAESGCRRGFAYRLSSSRCEDINECKEFGGICRGGSCRNTEGNYTCDCAVGMVYDYKKLSCVTKFDKCSQNPGVCGQGKCIPRIGGGYRCKCYSGYMLSSDGLTCKSKASYLRYDMCHYNRGYLCANGECVPQGRSYRCRCNQGFQLSSDGRSCKKVENFCKLYGAGVCENGLCRPVGSNDYRCDCNEGYEVSSDQRACISTCDRYGDSLCPNGQCVPSKEGGYACKCNNGFYQTLNRKKCIRAPGVLRTVCDFYTLCSNGRCVPMAKSYRCDCNSGYERASDGKSCRREDRIVKNHICDLFPDYYCPNAQCVKVGSNYRCQCQSGSEWKDGKCERRPRIQARKKGVTKRGKVTSDSIDFCLQYPQLCENGRCVPTKDYFYCDCDPGYKAVDDKRRCRRDETKPTKLMSGLYDFCYFYKDSACKGGACHNEPHTFWCSCPPGYYWQAKQLQCMVDNRRELASDEWSPYSSRRQKSYHYSACERQGREVCGKGYCVDKGSSFECRCYEGYELAQHNQRCVDINECDRNPSVCWQGQCVNTPGSYSCRCLKGFKLSHVNQQPMCVDRNECAEGNPCINGACRNLWGTYKCLCYDGYTSDDTGQQCLPAGQLGGQSIAAKKGLGTPSKPAELRSDAAAPDTTDFLSNCSQCSYDCQWISDGKYKCECPAGLVGLGGSDLCLEDNSVSQYTFDIQIDDEPHRRRKRSIPDSKAAAHRRARLILRDGVDVDHFTNSILGLYTNTRFYKIIRLGKVRGPSGDQLHTVVDIVFI